MLGRAGACSGPSDPPPQGPGGSSAARPLNSRPAAGLQASAPPPPSPHTHSCPRPPGQGLSSSLHGRGQGGRQLGVPRDLGTLALPVATCWSLPQFPHL